MSVELTYSEIRVAALHLAQRWEHDDTITSVYGIPRGGCVPAVLVADVLNLPLVDAPRPGTLVVDDVVDSGRTALRYGPADFDALYRKSHSPAGLADNAATLDDWLVFPWEQADASDAADNVVRLLEVIGEDPNRDGLRDTPGRVVKALREMTEGMALDPAVVLGTTFDVAHDELIMVSGIEFASLCEHHLLPFVGNATVGYLPGPRIVGLSKLARLVDCYARRLQVQERMTQQIAEAIMDVLDARGAGVVLQATHSCMACRGVRKQATMTTSAMLGKLRDEPQLRAEFLALR